MQQVAQFRGNKVDAEIHDTVFQLATEYGIPVTDENLTISFVSQHTMVKGSYKMSIDLLPGFKQSWPFTVDVDVISGIGAPPPRR